MSQFKKDTDFIKRGFITDDDRDEINNTVTLSTSLLSSLIEANKDDEIINDLNTYLEFNQIRDVIVTEYENYITDDLKLNSNASASKVYK